VKACIPAKQAPEALKTVLDTSLAKRNDSEEFADFIDRVGVAEFEEKFGKPNSEFGPLDRDNIQSYMDWGKTVVYKLERGEGECAV
jgi:dissimilatory sulfite reductase (desulfoviridin) alpha/beta subunit